MKTWTNTWRAVADDWREQEGRVGWFDGDGFDGESTYRFGFVRLVDDKRIAVMVVPGGGHQCVWYREIEPGEAATERAMQDCLGAYRLHLAYVDQVNRHGNDEQKLKLQAGTLTEEEGWKVVRDSIFQNLEQTHRRYQNIEWRDIPGAKRDDVMFSSGELFVRSFDLRIAFDRVFDAMGGGARVFPRWHRAHVSGATVLERYSVKVTVDFHGKVLAREYELPNGSVHTQDLGES